MAISVNPNRMELLKLKRRRAMAERGHKLLKDKFDELLKRFVAAVDVARKTRLAVEDELSQAFKGLAMASGEGGAEVVRQALMSSTGSLEVAVSEENLVGVQVPNYSLEALPGIPDYSTATTPAALDRAVDGFGRVFERLITLAQMERRVELLAGEIEKTRRRVNALEHVLIPQIVEAIRLITMNLEERERENLTRVIKIKEMLENQG